MLSGAQKGLSSLLPGSAAKVIRWQEPLRQQGIQSNRSEPALPFIRRPTPEVLGRGLVPQPSGRALAQHDKVLGVEAIDALEVPGSGHDLRVGFPRTRACIKQEHGSHVHSPARQDFTLGLKWIRSDPHASLKTTKAPRPQVATQTLATRSLCNRDIEEYQPPALVPRSGPLALRIAAPQCVEAPLLGEATEPVGAAPGSAFEELLSRQRLHLAEQSSPVSPAFVRIGEVTEGRSHERIRRPEQTV